MEGLVLMWIIRILHTESAIFIQMYACSLHLPR